MPNLTGLQLAAELRKIRPDIPIIIATGFSEAVEEDAASIGIMKVVMKPFLAREMHAAIRATLAKAQAK
jgi:DNA-binding response OmpR family regulator